MSTADIGTKFYIADGLPATFDQTGYEALTWVQVKGLVSIGEFGDDHAPISVPDLETGRSKTIKGEKTGTNSAVAFREIVADAGQGDMDDAAAAATGEYSFKIVDPSGAVVYASGVVMSPKRSERSASSYAGLSYVITNNYDVVKVAAA
ncbi:MAG: hypothetical protein H6881_08335 [Rhodobiaceae bacterium]|nr:hypothetical protein [Rhodobiaceae bacterium]MCC0051871.1 hypothetical protein [Rhodobiaceae bacterium]